jgi:hypothetical protein
MQSTDETHGLTNAYWPADRSSLDQSIGEALRGRLTIRIVYSPH